MNFGDILQQWEAANGEKTFDKDAAAQTNETRKRMDTKSYVQKLAPQDAIDLHGMTQEAALKALDIFVANAKRKGLRKILIIHGKGLHSADSECVLKSAVTKFIEGDKRLGASGKADKCHGGSGATWVAVRP